MAVVAADTVAAAAADTVAVAAADTVAVAFDFANLDTRRNSGYRFAGKGFSCRWGMQRSRPVCLRNNSGIALVMISFLNMFTFFKNILAPCVFLSIYGFKSSADLLNLSIKIIEFISVALFREKSICCSRHATYLTLSSNN